MLTSITIISFNEKGNLSTICSNLSLKENKIQLISSLVPVTNHIFLFSASFIASGSTCMAYIAFIIFFLRYWGYLLHNASISLSTSSIVFGLALVLTSPTIQISSFVPYMSIFISESTRFDKNNENPFYFNLNFNTSLASSSRVKEAPSTYASMALSLLSTTLNPVSYTHLTLPTIYSV